MQGDNVQIPAKTVAAFFAIRNIPDLQMTLQWDRKAQLHSHYLISANFYHTEIFRRHILAQPDTVL